MKPTELKYNVNKVYAPANYYSGGQQKYIFVF